MPFEHIEQRTLPVIESFQSYCPSPKKQFWYALSVVCSLGVTFGLAEKAYTLAVWLKLQPCLPKDACVVVAKLSTGKRVFCKVERSRQKQSTAWWEWTARQSFRSSGACLLIRINGDAYAYSGDSERFARVPRMPVDLPDQLELALHQLDSIDREGASWDVFNPTGSWPRKQRAIIYGQNQLPVRAPSKLHAIRMLLQSPLILAQAVLTAIWMWAYAYYTYPAVLFAILVIGSGASSYLLHQQRLRLVNLATQRHLIPVLYQNFVRALLAKYLVPGDVIVVQRGTAVCDMVLLRGTCLAEESMLSGEASQMRKVSHTAGVRYDPDVHRSSTLHAGSNIEQVWVDDDEQAEALAMVVRTGEYTTTGAMLRPLIHHQTDAAFSFRDDQVKDRLKFLGWSLAVNLLMFVTFIHNIITYQLGSTTALLQLLGFVLNAVPPLLVSLLVVLRFLTVLRLRHQRIFLSDTRKLQTAAQLDLVLFDKTGTLTVGQGYLHGVVMCDNCLLGGLKIDAITWSSDIRKAVALCNDLMPLSSRKIVGPASEKKTFTDVEAAFVGRNAVCLPLRQQSDGAAGFVTLDILHRLEFDAEYLMSGVIVRTALAKHEEPQIILKGSVHSVVQLVAHNRLPEDWAHVMMSWNAMGYRTMGVVSGKVTAQHQHEISKISLGNVNDHVREMRLLGLLVLTNPLRTDSVDAIAELQKKGRLKTMMVTGDHSMTGVAVSQQLGLMTKSQTTVVFDKEAPKKPSGGFADSANLAARATTFAASPLGGGQRSSQEMQRGLTEGSKLSANNKHSSSSRVSFAATHAEAAEAAAFRASLCASLLNPIVSASAHDLLTDVPASVSASESSPPIQPAAVVPGSATASASAAAPSPSTNPAAVVQGLIPVSASASDPAAASRPAAAVSAADDQALYARSASCTPVVQGATASSAAECITPAAALAASSMFFKSSSLLAPVSRTPSASGSTATAAAASRVTLNAPSPLLASYLKAMGTARRVDQAQPGVPANQSEPVAGHAGSPQRLSHADAGLSMDSTQAESRSDSQTHLLSESPPSHQPQSNTQLNAQSQDQTHATESPTARFPAWPAARTQLQAATQPGDLPESVWEEQRRKTSFDLKSWAAEQKKKQQHLQVQAASGPRHSLEIQAGHRNRSLDLTRADVKNVRLSFDSVSVPKDEKLRCWVIEMTAASVRVVSSKEAFDIVAAGAPCVITGFAFEHMVKEMEAAQVELAVRSAVLCARMKAHQKSHLVRLLGKGLQVDDSRNLKGLGHTVAYCGDGINDIAALHAADLGIAIGATEAIVAASVFTPAESAAVVCTLIREARCSVMISYSLFKYMVLYGFVESIVGCFAFFVAYTSLSISQYECMDFTALWLSLAALCTRPSRQLHNRAPPGKLMSFTVLAPLLLLGGCYCLQQTMAWHFLSLQGWYRHGHVYDAAVGTAMLVALFQLLLPAFAFFNDMRPHCMGFRHNPAVPAVVFAAALWWGTWDIAGKGFFADLIWLDTLADQFRLRIIAFAVLTFGGIKILLITTRWGTQPHRLQAAGQKLTRWQALLKRKTVS